MSQAEDLLNSLEPNEPVTYSVEPETEPHIIINRDKTVTIPRELQRILVQHEHNIETVTFDCPRYWDGHDLSKMGMRVVFERADGHREPHPVENLRIDDSDVTMIHFDWTISRNTTLVGGNIRITICAKITNAEGIADREWHTIPNDELYVNEGMDCSGDELVEEYPDVIDSILVRLNTLESTGGTGNGSNSGQNPALTTAQINALHGMFKVCAYDDSKDVSGAYAAFLTAFGITNTGGGEEEPDTPVTPEKTLTSISVTYSDGDVAVGTAVTDLTGIVVTANYSDGTSEPVTGYTLSGTIAEGANTVTVSYGGKTATFTVTGLTESGGGETTGNVVAMGAEVTHGDMKKSGHYSDGGSTALSDTTFPVSNGRSSVSEMVFEKDTKLRITLTPTGSWYQCMLFCSTLIDAGKVLTSAVTDNFYWCESSKAGFAYGWSAAEHTWEYTVKAGYKFGVITPNSGALPTKVEVIE